MFWTPDPLARTKRLLAVAKNELLDAEKGVEDYTAAARALKARVARLEAACQPAPTKQVERVTVGDITVQPPDLSPDTIKGLLRFTRRNG